MSRFNELRERILAAVDVAQGDGGERYAQGFKDAATLFLEMLDIALAPHSSGRGPISLHEVWEGLRHERGQGSWPSSY